MNKTQKTSRKEKNPKHDSNNVICSWYANRSYVENFIKFRDRQTKKSEERMRWLKISRSQWIFHITLSIFSCLVLLCKNLCDICTHKRATSLNFKSSCKFLKLFPANKPFLLSLSSKQRSISVHIFHSSDWFDILQRIIEFSSHFFLPIAIIISSEAEFPQPSSNNNQLHSSVRSYVVQWSHMSVKIVQQRIPDISSIGGYCQHTARNEDDVMVHTCMWKYSICYCCYRRWCCVWKEGKSCFFILCTASHTTSQFPKGSIELDLFNFQRFSPSSPVTVFATWLRSQRSHSGSISNGEKWPKNVKIH